MCRSFAVAALVAAMPAAGIAVRAVPAQNACATLSALSSRTRRYVGGGRVGSVVHPARLGADVGLPAFCRVTAVTKPAVNFEVWLPQHRMERQVPGCRQRRHGGRDQLCARWRTALKRGYAVASTDTGHVSKGSFDASWALESSRI